MRALTVIPGESNSIRLDELAAPPASDGAVLVRALALGICGTDHEIVNGDYGWAPPGNDRLTIGHESLGVVDCARPKIVVSSGVIWSSGSCDVLIRSPVRAARLTNGTCAAMGSTPSAVSSSVTVMARSYSASSRNFS